MNLDDVAMTLKDYDIPWQAAEGNVGITKKILLAISLILLIVIAGATLNVMDRVNMGLKTCSFEKEDAPMYDYKMRVLSRKLAENMIMAEVGDVRFTGDSLELCGSAFMFEALANETKYMVCETGEIYKMAKVCRQIGLLGRNKSS